MTGWLDPVRRALDASPGPIAIFFRNDDAGWVDERLFALLDVFEIHQFPIDLAVIPTALSATLAVDLLRRVQARCAVGVHQHGFAHQNHERNERRCEFGVSRSAAAQHADIATGQRMLLEAFGPFLDSVFTPPWNRCTSTTGRCLRDCGISTISRDWSAGLLNVDGLAECPIRVDWFARVKGARLSREEWAARLGHEIATAGGAPVGVMLHHARMDDQELKACKAVVKLFAGHPRVRGVLMRDATNPGNHLSRHAQSGPSRPACQIQRVHPTPTEVTCGRKPIAAGRAS